MTDNTVEWEDKVICYHCGIKQPQPHMFKKMWKNGEVIRVCERHFYYMLGSDGVKYPIPEDKS